MLVVAMQNAVDRPLRGVVTSLTIFARTIGSALGVTAQGAVLMAILAAQLGTQGGGPAKLPNPELVPDPAVRSRLGAAGQPLVRAALAHGLHGAFALGLVLVATGLAPVVLFAPPGSVTDRVPTPAAGCRPAT